MFFKQALGPEPAQTQPPPPGGRELPGRMDWFKAIAIGLTAGLILRTGFEMSISRAGLLLLGAMATGHDAQAASLVRAWILGGVVLTLGAGSMTALVVRAHRMLWTLVSMACVAAPLLTP